jgi:hypothetical protein
MLQKEELMWSGMCCALPVGVKNFMGNFMLSRGDKRNGKLIFIFGAISWALWLNRNDLVFNSKIISTPKALIYKCIFFLQHWVIAVTGPDKEDLEQLAEVLRGNWILRGRWQEWDDEKC